MWIRGICRLVSPHVTRHKKLTLSQSRLLPSASTNVSGFSTTSRQRATAVKVTDIAEFIRLREVEDKTLQDRKTLVFLFTWIGSKQKAYDKCCELYHERGWDVVEIVGSIKYVLNPTTVATGVVKNLLEYIKDSSSRVNQSTSYLMHSASIGVFLYGLMLQGMHEDESFNPYLDRVKGQILDSPTMGDPQEWNEATVNSLTQNRLLQVILRSLCSTIWTKDHVKVFADMQDYMAQYLIPRPMLYLCAKNDPMHNFDMAVPVLDNLGKRMPILLQAWEKSKHAAHMKLHEKEYKEIHNRFLSQHIIGKKDKKSRASTEEYAPPTVVTDEARVEQTA